MRIPYAVFRLEFCPEYGIRNTRACNGVIYDPITAQIETPVRARIP